MKNIYFIFIIATIISSCKKNRNSVSWNTFCQLPISTDTLNLNSFIKQEKLYLSDDGTYLSFKDTFKLYELGQNIINQSIQLDFVDSIKIQVYYQEYNFLLDFKYHFSLQKVIFLISILSN